ncbi:Heterokaryon incompatibility protein [Rutstroemia sp. NJR-2017a BVV2]|nr:Heterokaryon incompatibility protein [Rutstroemia sp. NJR-2017a BVV2]PQE18502.1 Heterokaryon incompatibility protein [Rutstroemia sp. NJR-2017a BVV2]
MSGGTIWGEDVDTKVPAFEVASVTGIAGTTTDVDEEQLSEFLVAKARQQIIDQPQEPRVNISSALPGSIYRPLMDDYDIRVIEVFPGSFESEVCCVLHHCSVEFEYQRIRDDPEAHTSWQKHTRHAVSLEEGKPVRYTALSYVWGAPVFDCNIKCNGQGQKITKNLFSALRHLRRDDYSIMLWIDQICINQMDIAERERQVRIMSLIYRRAWNTAIWLGEEAEGSFRAFQTLESAVTILRYVTEVPPEEDFRSLQLPDARSELWEELWKLFKRPWFQRLWVIQEVVLSFYPYIVCGEVTIAWGKFQDWCIVVKDSGLLAWLRRTFKDGLDQTLSGCEVCLSMSDYERVQSSTTSALMMALVNTRYAQATDPRDKVYGLLGLYEQPIEADYSKEVSTVYRETTLLYLLEAIKRINKELKPGVVGGSMALQLVFHVFSCVNGPSSLPGLPSWLPDWSQGPKTTSLGYAGSASHIYSAAKWIPDGTVVLNSEGKALCASGILFDTIDSVTPVSHQADISYKNPITENGDLATYVEFVRKCHPYPSGSGLFEAFWKTLVAGKDESGMQPCPPTFADIFSLILDETTGLHPSLPDQTYSPRRLQGRLTLHSLSSRASGRLFNDICSAYASAMKNRRLCITSKKFIGLVPEHAAPGDHVCVFIGGCVPFVIRKQDEGSFHMIGECYVHGIMNGEIADMELDKSTIKLV